MPAAHTEDQLQETSAPVFLTGFEPFLGHAVNPSASKASSISSSSLSTRRSGRRMKRATSPTEKIDVIFLTGRGRIYPWPS